MLEYVLLLFVVQPVRMVINGEYVLVIVHSFVLLYCNFVVVDGLMYIM